MKDLSPGSPMLTDQRQSSSGRICRPPSSAKVTELAAKAPTVSDLRGSKAVARL